MSLVGHDDLGRPFIVGVNNTKKWPILQDNFFSVKIERKDITQYRVITAHVYVCVNG